MTINEFTEYLAQQIAKLGREMEDKTN